MALDLLSPWLGLASLEDWVGLLRMLSLGLLLLGRIHADVTCGDNHAVYVWDAQRCNPMALAHGMPHDQLLAMYLWPMLYHSAMQGALSLKALALVWVVLVVFLLLANAATDTLWTAHWTILLLPLVMTLLLPSILLL
jgi:hypothetical protein